MGAWESSVVALGPARDRPIVDRGRGHQLGADGEEGVGPIIVRGALPEGMVVEPRRQIRDDRGAVMHILRADAPYFERFGEVYVSIVCETAVKAWKRHRIMTQHMAVPVGGVALVGYDDRSGSPTRGALVEVHTGAEMYGLVRIPAMLWYGFRGLGPGDAVIVNCASHPHDPGEVQTLPLDAVEIPYKWSVPAGG
jgi:dTDP-4-dehydrorhamnose 3,5-epimerase